MGYLILHLLENAGHLRIPCVIVCTLYCVHTKGNSMSSVTASHSEHSLCVSNPEHVAIFYNAFVLPFKNCMCLTDIVWNVALIPSTLLPDDKETSQAALGKLL